jgi:hypothetical protein
VALDRWRSQTTVLAPHGLGSRATTVVSALSIAVLLGVVIGLDPPRAVMIVPALVAVVGAVVIVSTGWLLPFTIIVLSATAVDALPGPTLIGGVPYSMVLVLPVLFWAGWGNLARLPRWLLVSCGALFGWWLVCALRAWAAGAPPALIVKDDIDFGAFPLLVVGFAAVGLDAELRRRLLIGFGVLAVWVASVNIAAGLDLVDPVGGFLAHGYNATSIGGLTRVYAWSSEYVAAALPFALGATLMAGSRKMRIAAAMALVLFLVQVLLGLGRVQWAGTAGMVTVMLLLWGRPYVRRIAALVTVSAAVLFAATAAGPLRGPAEQVTDRVTSIFAGSTSRASDQEGDTLAYRDRYKAAIRRSLSTTEWIAGHGFKPRQWYVFPPDAIKSLRNSDLGWYNALNTMGLVGVVLLFAPVVLVLLACWRARRAPPREHWMVFGGMGYALYAIAVSQTLVVLFGPALAVGAAALGLSLASALSGRPGPR